MQEVFFRQPSVAPEVEGYNCFLLFYEMSNCYLTADSGQACSLDNQKLNVDGLIEFTTEFVGSLSLMSTARVTAEIRQLAGIRA